MLKPLLYAALPLMLTVGTASAYADTIKIGVPVPLSGPYASAGIDIANAAKMAAAKINAAGGVLGKQLEILPEDDACDAQQGVQAAQKLIDAGVAVVAGGYCSGAALPELGALHRAGISYVLDASTNPKLTSGVMTSRVPSRPTISPATSMPRRRRSLMTTPSTPRVWLTTPSPASRRMASTSSITMP
jgi:ABC-type branched-subunit amino acid transport system substrate-binding protein